VDWNTYVFDRIRKKIVDCHLRICDCGSIILLIANRALAKVIYTGIIRLLIDAKSITAPKKLLQPPD
jgi:hypothetical protein